MRQKPSRRIEIAGNAYILGDAVQACREHIPGGTVDLIITDPPYGINGGSLHKHYNRDENYVLDGYIEIPAADYQQFSLDWIREAERVLRPGGQIYIVSGYTRLYEILHALRQTGLTELNHLIWKYNFGVHTRRKFISSHYHILLYAKPPLAQLTFALDCRYGLEERDAQGGSLNYRDREDVWIINREYKQGRAKNKNELPAALLIKMLQYSSREGDLVLDPFLGGFTTARACIGLGRRVIGCELSPTAFEHGLKLVRALQPGFLLPELRRPAGRRLLRRGSSWSEDERQKLLREYLALRAAGNNKREAVAVLTGRFQRGRLALERALRSLGH